jgi:hypothetical protein
MASRDCCQTSCSYKTLIISAAGLRAPCRRSPSSHRRPAEAANDHRARHSRAGLAAGYLLAGLVQRRWASACCSLQCSRRSLSIILQRARYPGIWSDARGQNACWASVLLGAWGPERLARLTGTSDNCQHMHNQSTSNADPPTDEPTQGCACLKGARCHAIMPRTRRPLS